MQTSLCFYTSFWIWKQEHHLRFDQEQLQGLKQPLMRSKIMKNRQLCSVTHTDNGKISKPVPPWPPQTKAFTWHIKKKTHAQKNVIDMGSGKLTKLGINRINIFFLTQFFSVISWHRTLITENQKLLPKTSRCALSKMIYSPKKNTALK